MISITINADSVGDLHAQFAALLQLDRGGAIDATAAPEKPKATRSTKAKTETPAEKAVEPQSDASETGAAGTVEQTTASPSEPDEIKKRAMKFTQKAGPQAIKELIVNAGQPEGAFGKLDADGLVKLDAALTELGY